MPSGEFRYFSIDDNHRHQNDWDIANPVKLDKDDVLLSIDTNVFLNLYKVSGTSLDVFKTVLKKLKDENLLFVTDEAVREFWKGRPGVIEASRDSFNATEGYLDSSYSMLEKATEAMSQMDGRYGADGKSEFSAKIRTWQKDLERLLEQVKEGIGQIKDSNPAIRATSVNEDPVVRLLRDVLRGNVGPALVDGKVRDKLFKEAKEAAEIGRAPGATDKNKISKSDLGDYLIWRQILDRVSVDDRPRLKTVLVTAEKKWDWWRSENPVKDVNRKPNEGNRVGAHLDLIEDYTKIRPEGMIYVWDVEQLVTEVDKRFNLGLDEKDVKAAVTQSAANVDAVEVTLRSQKITRHGVYNPDDGTLTVGADTVMRAEETASCNPTAKNLRKKLIQEKIVAKGESDDEWVFTEDYEFSSASTAASVLTGSSMSWIVWKTEDGVSIRDHMESLEEITEREDSE